MTTAPGTTITAPRELVSASMFDRLTRRVMVDHGTDQTAAEQVTDQALAFLQACALDPAAGLAPSAGVDKGWHAFILHTADYAEFCQRVAGRFIHHLPAEPGDRGQRRRREPRDRDRDARRRAPGRHRPVARVRRLRLQVPPVPLRVPRLPEAGVNLLPR
jgi:hypothetical protein